MFSLALFIQASSSPGNRDDGEDANIGALIAAARDGDRDAFDEIMFQFRDQVFCAAWKLTRNHEDAMDVTQETFIRSWHALSSYKGRSRFSTWLHRITLNTGIDYLRREKRHRHASLDAPSHEVPDSPAPDPRAAAAPASQREHVYARELQAQVLKALDQLSARQRQVFILRYYHDLDTRETAKVIKCTEGSVKRHLFRAQARLRELLNEMEFPDHEK